MTIDWEEQWACFAPRFINGKAHIELPAGQEMRLLPGPGFGDYSHPTTKLMVALMSKLIPHQITFDIGSGSGILSVAAAKMGAKQVYACDIDPEAISHTKKNGGLNEVKIETDLPLSFSEKPTILLNMISSEQMVAWEKYSCPFNSLITSGVLATSRTSYLNFAQANHWKLIDERELDGWLGFTFKEISSP